MTKETEIINKIFKQAANNFKYRWGVLKIEKKLKTHPELINEDVCCKLGLLYDHFALTQKNSTKKKYLENRALNLYKTALKINPLSYRATWAIGRVWWHRKSKKAIGYAIRAYRLKKKLGGGMGLYAQNVGLVYQALKNYKKAESWLLKGMKENKKEFGVYLNLVNFYQLIGNLGKAKKYNKSLKKLYAKETKKFKKTLWGKKIKEIIRTLDKKEG